MRGSKPRYDDGSHVGLCTLSLVWGSFDLSQLSPVTEDSSQVFPTSHLRAPHVKHLRHQEESGAQQQEQRVLLWIVFIQLGPRGAPPQIC